MDGGFIFFALLINFVLSLVVARFAENKGLRFAPYFWLSFLLSWFVGILFVAAAPSRALVKAPEEKGLHVTCPHCAEQIRAEANVCKHCGRDVVARIDLIEIAREQVERDLEARHIAELNNARGTRIAWAVVLLILAAFALTMSVILFVISPASAKGGAYVFGFIGAIPLVIGIIVLASVPKKPLNADGQ